MNKKSFVVALLVVGFLMQVNAQNIIQTVNFAEIAERYNTLSMEGEAMKWIQTIRVDYGEMKQTNTPIEVMTPIPNQIYFGQPKLYVWDPMFKAWEKVGSNALKQEALGLQFFYRFSISKPGLYGIFNPLEDSKASLIEVPSTIQLQQLKLVSEDLKVALKFDHSVKGGKIKVPIAFPPAAMQITATWLDKNGKVCQVNNVTLAQMDALNQSDLDQGKWTLDFDTKQLLAVSQTPKK
jgi:hypothetical protein